MGRNNKDFQNDWAASRASAKGYKGKNATEYAATLRREDAAYKHAEHLSNMRDMYGDDYGDRDTYL